MNAHADRYTAAREADEQIEIKNPTTALAEWDFMDSEFEHYPHGRAGRVQWMLKQQSLRSPRYVVETVIRNGPNGTPDHQRSLHATEQDALNALLTTVMTQSHG